MVEIDSADVLEMRDAKVSDLLDDINRKALQTPTAQIVAWTGAIVGVGLFFIDAKIAGAFLLIAFVGWLVALWVDSYQRKAVLFYDLESVASGAYEELTKAFDELTRCQGKWHIAADGRVEDLTTWKRNAGATRIVAKKPTVLSYALPKLVASNITPPSALAGKQMLYFFPDVVLVVQGKKVGAVGYADLVVRWQDSNFIEEGAVPSDAVVIGQTWKHPNKSGGPDRRFRDNYQIPICLYEVLHLGSASGLNELLEFSRIGGSEPLAKAAKALGTLNGHLSVPALRAS